MEMKVSINSNCHCEERSDEAIPIPPPVILRESRFYRDDRRISVGEEHDEILRYAQNDTGRRTRNDG